MEPVDKLRLISEKYNILFLTNILLEDPRFAIWSGSSKSHQHHYGKGQLAKHTLEVVELCLQTNDYYGNPVAPEHLVLAAMFHDCGKMFDYTPTDNTYVDWTGNTHKRKIHHITRSALLWSGVAQKNGIGKEVEDDILHAIISHHGQREWGSPVGPSTKLAWILHLCDGLSARINDCEKFDGFKK